MKFISHYKEFGKDEHISILDNISHIPTKEKSKILEYLKHGEDAGVKCSSVFDFVQNELVPRTIHRYTDGEYIWDDREIYHFEKYNIPLDEDFIKKVLVSMESEVQNG